MCILNLDSWCHRPTLVPDLNLTVVRTAGDHFTFSESNFEVWNEIWMPNPREFSLMILIPVICYASGLCSFSLSIFDPPHVVMFYHDAAKHVFFPRFNIPLTYRTIIWCCDVPSPLIRMENARVYHGLVTWSLCSVHKIIVTFYRSCDKKTISIV